jgi:hypothetical protein
MTIKEKLHKALAKIKTRKNKVRDVAIKASQSDKLSKKIKSHPPSKRTDEMKSMYKSRKSAKALKIMPE